MGEAADDIEMIAMRQEWEHQEKGDPIRHIAQQIIDRLKAEGFIIQRYDAYSTNSIYLKLDYGVCNSIRIADHPGKKHLNYRYNLMLKYEKYRYETTKEDWVRHYYPIEMIDKMIAQILEDREIKQKRFGPEQYRVFMRQHFVQHQDSAGFWSQAVLV